MKKNFLFIILIALVCFYVSPVFAANITGCDILDGALIDVKIANLVHTVIVAIKIAVPVILVVMGMLDLLKGLTAQKDEEIKKGQQVFIKRLIAAVLVFFIISIVQLLVSFVSDDEGIMTCASCFINGANKNNGHCNK